MNGLPNLYTRKEAAAKLKISARQIDYLIAQNLIPYGRKRGRGPMGQIVFTEDDLRRIIESWRVGPTTAKRSKKTRGHR